MFLTVAPGRPLSPGKPRKPGGPSLPGDPCGPGSPCKHNQKYLCHGSVLSILQITKIHFFSCHPLQHHQHNNGEPFFSAKG